MTKGTLRCMVLVFVGLSAAGCQSSGSIASLQTGGDYASSFSASAGNTPVSTAMQAGAPAEAPLGYYSFCMRTPDQCPADAQPAPLVQATAMWPLLTLVNAQVNTAIAPESDAQHYGVAEYWTIPTDGAGDCKSYTLTKRKVLHDAGIPFADLRVGVVKLWDDELHAVLLVSTDHGDYVLDNLRQDIRPWTETGYSWIETMSRTGTQWATLPNTARDAATAPPAGGVIGALPPTTDHKIAAASAATGSPSL